MLLPNAIAFLMHAAALWLWHVSSFFEAGLVNETILNAKTVWVIPKEHRFVPVTEGAMNRIRDYTGRIEAVIRLINMRGVILRSDRYVAAAFCAPASCIEIDAILSELLNASDQAENSY